MPVGKLKMQIRQRSSSMFLTRVAMISVCAFTAFPQRPSAPAQTVGSETGNWSGALADATRTDCGVEVEHAVKPGTCPVSMCTALARLLEMAQGKLPTQKRPYGKNERKGRLAGSFRAVRLAQLR